MPPWANPPVFLLSILHTHSICIATHFTMAHWCHITIPYLRCLLSIKSVIATTISTSRLWWLSVVSLWFLFLFRLWELTVWNDRVKSTRETVWPVRDNNRGENSHGFWLKESTSHHAMLGSSLWILTIFWQTHRALWRTHTHARTLSVAISLVVEQVARRELHLLVACCILYHTVVVDCWFGVFLARLHCRSSSIAMVVVSKICRCPWFSRVRPSRSLALSGRL